MKTQDLMAVLGVAAVTMAFALAVVQPAQLAATDTPSGIVPEITRPKLEMDGCVLVLSTDKTAYATGETPVVSIQATNPTREAVQTNLSVRISSTSPASRFSRRLVRPEILWSHQHPLTLKPGETKVVTLASETPLPEGKSISISIGDERRSVLVDPVQVLKRGESGKSDLTR